MGNFYIAPIVGYASNRGRMYCTCHNVEKPGVLGTFSSRNVQETIKEVRADGMRWEEAPCDWPGCTNLIGGRTYTPELVDMSLQENILKYDRPFGR